MRHTIHIEKIVHGGRGLARLENGMIVLVPFVVPGETVTVKEVVQKRGYIEAEPLEILVPSPDRTTPPCPYYMRCGGCDLQHMNPDTQHLVKETVIRESLSRAGVPLAEQILHPLIPSPQGFHYRYRIRLKVSPEGLIGYFRAGSNEIVDVAQCLVATHLLNKALAEIREGGMTTAMARNTEEIELLHSPADDRVFCVLHPRGNAAYPPGALSGFAASCPTVTGLAVNKGRRVEIVASDAAKSMLRQEFDESVCGRPYALEWPPGGFAQVNAALNPRLVALACRLAGEAPGTVLDLFCGMGNFSIPLALRGAAVTGIEHHSESIARAKENAVRNAIGDTRFLDQDVHKWLRKAVRRSAKYGIILVDPPRRGVGGDIRMLADLAPRKILYVSCDPATLARDIAILDKKGFRLANITPVDMFPQTHHIEIVALLEMN